MRKVLIATPAFGNLVNTLYMHSVIELLQFNDKNIDTTNTEFVFKTIGNESLITRARNHFAAMIMHDESFTHLLFIDADICFKIEQVYRLLDFDQEVVAGVYPQKRINWEQIQKLATAKGINSKNLEARALHYNLNVDKKNIVHKNGFLQVLDAATGFMLIKRDVFKALAEKYPKLSYQVDHNPLSSKKSQWAFFDTTIDEKTHRYLSEDYAFCRLYQSIGGNIWCDIESPLSHIGSHVYTGDIKEAVTLKNKKRFNQNQ